jgi:L-serine/L-threonine ammonia-lyase
MRECTGSSHDWWQLISSSVLVPAYDHPTLWEGHGSMIAKISQQLGREPGMIACSVGGGGLVGGVMTRCMAAGWENGDH